MKFHISLDNLIVFSICWIGEGPLTQEVEYLPFKQRVVGSSPARPTIPISDCELRILELL